MNTTTVQQNVPAPTGPVPEELLNKRTGVGIGLGIVLGFIFGGPMGAGIGAVVGGGVAHASGKNKAKGEMTPERKLIYARAMQTIKNPADLLTLAAAFEKEGFRGEALMLRKRAGLRNMSPQVKEQRRNAFRAAMASDNPDAIEAVAQAFRDEGAIDAAKNVQDHANAVRAAHAAGKSGKPLDERTLEAWATKLGYAVMHFGPKSGQASSAARNFLMSMGRQPTPANIANAITDAQSAITVPADAGATTAEAASVEDTSVATENDPNADGASAAPTATPDDTTPVAATGDANDPATAEPQADGTPAPAVEPPAPVDNPPAASVAGEAKVRVADDASDEPNTDETTKPGTPRAAARRRQQG